MTQCPICKQRKTLKAELDSIEEDSGSFIRELRRTRNPITKEPGVTERLDECNCKPFKKVSDIMIPEWHGEVMKRTHHHECPCGRRYPKEGEYEGEYADPELH